jgi:hypothetical protein
MSGNWLVRLKAVVLASLLVSGGGGMPLLDVALFHATTGSHPIYPHFEASHGADGHGDYCRQGTALPHAPGAVRPEAGPRVVEITFQVRLGPPASVLPSAELPHLLRPRPPPASVA